jgi:hypothetical protein
MAERPQAQTGTARAAGATDFKLECNNNGFIIRIHPNPGAPISGKCIGLSTAIEAGGVKVVEVVMQTDDLGTCTWRKVGGVWVCV